MLVLAMALLGVAPAAHGGVTSDAQSLCKNGGWVEWGFRNQGQCVRTEARGMLFVLNDEFLTSPDAQNPNPDRYGNASTWSFLASQKETVSDPSTYVLMAHYNVGQGPHAGQEGWEHAAVQPGKGPWAYPFVHTGGPGRPVSPHPGEHGLHPEISMVAWTSPFGGTVEIQGRVWDGDDASLPGSGCFTIQSRVDGVDWDIRTSHGNLVVAHGAIADGGSQSFPDGLTLKVEPGSTIWFQIGPGRNFLCDQTRTDIVLVGHPARGG
jgi:hypothetical protein